MSIVFHDDEFPIFSPPVAFYKIGHSFRFCVVQWYTFSIEVNFPPVLGCRRIDKPPSFLKTTGENIPQCWCNLNKLPIHNKLSGITFFPTVCMFQPSTYTREITATISALGLGLGGAIDFPCFKEGNPWINQVPKTFKLWIVRKKRDQIQSKNEVGNKPIKMTTAVAVKSPTFMVRNIPSCSRAMPTMMPILNHAL